MTSKETYEYGTLLALIRDQNKAIQKQANGELGWWGRGRIRPRGLTMVKFAFNIFRSKAERLPNLDAVNESIVSDLKIIACDPKVWGQVSDSEIDDVILVFESAEKYYLEQSVAGRVLRGD
ncbi:hypothetical protein ACFL34_00490 [Candidatus Sumerlaeota bacterium]